jgi:hypothetical protein
MKYRKRNIDQVFQNKNWEGVKGFTDRFGMDLLILLDGLVKERNWEGLKEFVQRFSIEPLVEYGIPVGGEGVRELYEISDRFHGHKQKTGAEWWVRDELTDVIQQLKGYAGDPALLDKIAMAWKDVDARVAAAPETKASAFRKVLITALIQGIYRPAFKEEAQAMERIDSLFEQMDFKSGIQYRDEFVE